MKNKKGFTLIELLAVLVVLAILALISIPITIRIINNARENSYKRSIEGYGRAVEIYLGKYLTEHNVDYKTIKLSDIEDNISSGNNVRCTSLSFKDNGDIVLRHCKVHNSKLYKYENKKVVEDVYEVGELITVNNIAFYIISNKVSDDYIVALKAEPLTVQELIVYGLDENNINHINRYTLESVGIPYVWNQDGIIGNVSFYSNDDCGWVNGSLIRTGCNNDYLNSDIKVIVDNWARNLFKNQELKSVLLANYGNYNSRLLTKNEYRSISNSNSWKFSPFYHYWLMDKYSLNNVDNEQVFYIHMDGGEYHGDVFNNYQAVRPVINVYKAKID